MSILSDRDFAQILPAAITAPSGGNMQPWLIRRDSDAVGLSVNHTRSHNLLDVQGTAAIFSLGMLAENVLITADSLGYRCTLDLSTDHRFPTGNLVATVVFSAKSAPNEAISRLAQAVPLRCTNRRLHRGKPYPDDKIVSLGRHFKGSDCSVSFVGDPASKQALFEILASNDVFRLRHQASLKQLLNEIRWSEQQTNETRDGIDITSLELPKAGELFLRLIHRRPEFVHKLPALFLKQFSRLPIFRSSHLGLVSLDQAYSDIAMFQAGRHTQRLWLNATVEKIGLQPYTVITFNYLRVILEKGEGFTQAEQTAIEADAGALCRIFELAESAVPVFVFRLVRAAEPATRSLRLPTTSFLT